MEAKNYTSLASALVSLFGNAVAIARTDRLSGGDINKAYAVTLNTGDTIFMKANAKEKAASFESEARGLEAIASCGAIATPKILGWGTDDGEEVGYSFLLLEYVKSANKKADYWQIFGRSLAAMHRADTQKFLGGSRNGGKPQTGGATKSGGKTETGGATKTPARFGFMEDNCIGARPQQNEPRASWVEFFRDCRLAPQFKAAESWFDSEDANKIARLLERLDKILVEPQFPSLLHGDLWSGNAMPDASGNPMLIDPACYVGSAEADLAMTELFGGFAPDFYAAYKEALPLEPGYDERRDIYNLYHLLNHLNIFGASYLGPVKSILDEYSSI